LDVVGACAKETNGRTLAHRASSGRQDFTIAVSPVCGTTLRRAYRAGLYSRLEND